ncbi:helix-turn-helix transcriptional regulator [Mesorhizobium sp. ES1-3]|uniref:helix-turn-helix transcriptional regulator n=1 Tax=Mesorhizobium sp. ES1-3 TaxID=2876628 RepID=UPI001CCCD775|nr:AlpA family phage regulatory protein [Mesorhizobium sp. ES1-3]MBZ9673441.1 AlpA family phage regulatory protein [Mesorhizobium sp. ES1-3]
MLKASDGGRAKRFLRRSDVQDFTGLPTSTLYELMQKGEFPKPINLSPRTVGWIEDEVIAWQEAKIAQRDHAAEAA